MKILTKQLRDRLSDLSEELGLTISKRRQFDPPFGFGELICEVFDDTAISDAIEEGTLSDDLGPPLAVLINELDLLFEEIFENDRPLYWHECVRFRELVLEIISGLDRFEHS